MITGLNHITFAVKDLERSLKFYSEVLGFTGHVKWDNGAYLSLNAVWLCLSKDDSMPAQDYSHIAWTVNEVDFPKMKQRVEKSGARIWKANKSEGDSVYFLDPDGHKLELHVGSLQQRLESLKRTPYSGLEWLTDQ